MVFQVGLLRGINNSGLLVLREEGETTEDILKVSPKEFLMRWVNYHLEKAGCSRGIRNFATDIQDSEAYSCLLEQIAPRESGVNSSIPLLEDDLTKRAEKMLQEAEKIDCRAFVSPGDVVKGNHKLNMAFVANLFKTYPALEPLTDPDIEEGIFVETREENTYRNWMNSMGIQPQVNYLYSDLNDGLVILKIYDIYNTARLCGLEEGCNKIRQVKRKL
ncbi:hypothetical protein FSP39_000007 [Pinctada imbricata]|uniref:Calponin-homology (CH) domain-containing protein n=1 Tax=Pinctada imbricata TaxID=66713 RepID=A0AA88YP18_PINIB|nr:hypothetical protein FSP39_000007 [Pinctada imbricata]